MAVASKYGLIYFMLLIMGTGLVGCGEKQTENTPQSLTGASTTKSSPLSSATPPLSPNSAITRAISGPDDAIVETQYFYSGPREPRPEDEVDSEASHGKTAYLTFDDGPSQSTKRILDILKSFHIPATFFVIGSDTTEGRALYKQIVAEGHALGNHSYSHDYNTIYKSPEAFRKDVRKLDRLLEETVGFRPDILRFPGGSNNHLSRKAGGRSIMSRVASAMREDGYQYVDWNVSSTDAAAPVQDKNMIIDSVIGASKGKQNIIVLMHDNTYKTTTVEALPIVIKRLQAAGFRFAKLTKFSYTFQFLTT
ncbi:polysaccharide deacetylase family protein [Paenibacillus sp. SI8]|uniref:polysaccharide deacetylase family protein n=1 Tax=unclassified Paenibacillus TaxID=185978 RepID=UPI0034658272